MVVRHETHLITKLVLPSYLFVSPYSPFAVCERLKIFPFILSVVLICFTRTYKIESAYSNLFQVHTLSDYNHLVFEN